MRTSPLLLLMLTTACGEGASSEPGPDAPGPAETFPTSGVYAASYRVPVEDPALETAATYPVDHVEWTITGSSLVLHYDLPVGLVGGKLDVTFTGTIDPATDRIAISGANGTGTCELVTAGVSCTELFVDLGTLPISMAVVEAQAAIEYPGPVSDRRTVATLFGSDPIGIVDVDPSRPIVED